MSTNEAPELPALTDRERKFCEALAGEAEGNRVRACEIAGYSGDYGTLATQAYRMLKKADVRQYLAGLLEADPLVMTRTRRLRRLTEIAEGKYTETKVNSDGEAYEANPPARDIIAAIKELGLLAGDYVTKVAATDADGNDVERLPLATLFALTGIDVSKIGGGE